MASPSVTYTFTNGTTSDASQVNQNFTDLINSLTDGTKSLSVDSLTAGGTSTFNGAVNLGNGSIDDITITGSLASSIPVKTTASYDIGSSTLGLRSIYFGNNSHTVRIIGSGSMSATWTMTLPTTAGTADYVLKTDGSGVTSWTSLFDPTAFTDAQATALGFKGYLADKSGGSNDIAYNGSVKATISLTAGGGTITAIDYAVLIPYEIQAGIWRVRGNISSRVSSNTRSNLSLSINGLTFANMTSSDGQAICGMSANSNTIQSAFADNNASTVSVNHTAGATTAYYFSFDVRCNSKPTWAY